MTDSELHITSEATTSGATTSGATTTGLAPNIAGALAYFLGPITGVAFYVMEKENRFVRFHAAQSIVVGVALIALYVALSILAAILAFIPVLGWILALLLTLGVAVVSFVLWVVLMWKAFSNHEWEAPIAGRVARRIAASGSHGHLALALALALLSAAPISAQQPQLRTEWSKNATEFRGQNGRRVTLVCPPNGTLADVYGTDIYTDDSYVCSAAVHAGVITTATGGLVTIAIAPGQGAYKDSVRNGVASKSFGRWSGSYSFERNGEGRVDWTTTAKGLELAGGPVTVVCPAVGGGANIWGTDIYTDDSSICTAAVHAGAISFAAGGRVTIQAAGEMAEYKASARNGVASRDFANWPNSFRIAGAAVAPTAVLRAPAGSVIPVAPAAVVLAPAGSVIPVAQGSPPLAETPLAVGSSQSASTAAPTGSATLRAGAVMSPATRAASQDARGLQGAVGSDAPSALPAPTGVTAVPVPGGQVRLTWNAVPGAALYHVLYRTAGASGWYTLTDRPGDQLPTGTQYQSNASFVLLPAGTLEFSVYAGRDAQDYAGALSDPVRMAVARYSGRYRVTVNGFRVNRERKDDKLEADGKRNEVHVRVSYREYNPDGTPAGPERNARSKTHGDINHPDWQKPGSDNYRYRAGSASALGGLMTGDGFPDQAQPWLRRSGATSTETFPLLVWEGFLMKGGTQLQLIPAIFEDDFEPQERTPVGVYAYNSNNQGLFTPTVIALSFEKAEEIVTTKDPNSPIPAGIIPIQIKDINRGLYNFEGDFTLYLEVQRIE